MELHYAFVTRAGRGSFQAVSAGDVRVVDVTNAVEPFHRAGLGGKIDGEGAGKSDHVPVGVLANLLLVCN